MCRLPSGCIGEDVLPDQQLVQFTARYRLARKIYEANKISELLMVQLRELGLMEDPELLKDLELIFLEGCAQERKREDFRKQFRK